MKIDEMKQRLDPKCWTGKHKEGTKIKGGVRVNNCVPNESANPAQQAAIAIAKKKEKGISEMDNGQPQRAVDAKGRTQQQWIQAVKSKFPNAKIMQAKMIDGPCHAILPDGRKFNWTPVQDSLNEFLDTQATAQDPGLEKEPDVDVIFFGQMPRDFTADTVWEALEAVLPREYPPGRNDVGHPISNAERVTTDISKNGGAVVTNKPLSVAKKLVKTFQTYGIKCRLRNTNESVAEDYNPEYDDEAGMAQGNLYTIAKAAQGLLDTIDDRDNLPEWAQEKIAKVEGMLVTVWNYLQSQKAQGIDPEIEEMYEAMDRLALDMARKNRVSVDAVWESFEALPDNMLYETAAWHRKAGKNKNGGLNRKGVMSYRREHPGSKLQTAVTTKPSKLKPGSKAAKRRKSFCARMSGVKGPMKKPNGKPTRKALALRKWNC